MLLERDELGALLVQHLPNIRYLTGFTGSAGLLLVSAQATVLVTDFRYATQAPQEAVGIDVQIDPSSIWDRLGRVLLQWNVERLGVESHVLTTRDADRLSITVDGVVRGSVELPAGLWIGTGAPLRIGGNGLGRRADTFHGAVDEVYVTVG